MKTALVGHVPHCTVHGQCARSAAHEAYFCNACNEWAGKKCLSASCEFCAGRPEKPAPVEEKAKGTR